MSKKTKQKHADAKNIQVSDLSTSRRKKIALLLILLLTAIITTALTVLLNKDDSAEMINEDVLACSETEEGSLSQRASALIDRVEPEKLKEMQLLVQEIEQLDDYRDDQNCLYITTVYYISISDGEKARDSLNSLKSVYNSEGQSATTLIPVDSKFLDGLEDKVAFLEEIDKNSLGSPSFGDDPNEE